MQFLLPHILRWCWSPRVRAHRALAICNALDYAISDVMAQAGCARRMDIGEAAHIAVQANATQSGAVARIAQAHLQRAGVVGVELASLRGHDVLRDRITGLLHDLECYAGACRLQDLPLAGRGGSLEVSLVAVAVWPTQRRLALAIARREPAGLASRSVWVRVAGLAKREAGSKP